MSNETLITNFDDKKKGKKDWHPYRSFRDKTTKWDMAEKLNLCCQFIEKHANEEKCKNRMRSKPKWLKCNCLEVLRDNRAAQEAVSCYMVYFYEKSKPDRQEIVMQWLEHDKDMTKLGRKYLLPVLQDINYDEEDVMPLGEMRISDFR